jgi:hypothetical protein
VSEEEVGFYPNHGEERCRSAERNAQQENQLPEASLPQDGQDEQGDPTAATTKDMGTSEAIGFCGYMKTFEGALHS